MEKYSKAPSYLTSVEPALNTGDVTTQTLFSDVNGLFDNFHIGEGDDLTLSKFIIQLEWSQLETFQPSSKLPAESVHASVYRFFYKAGS